MIKSMLGSLVAPVVGAFTKRDDNKTKIQAAKLALIKKEKDAKAAWELVKAENEDGSWKDEYITVIITLPIVVTFFAVLWSAFTGEPEAADAAAAAVAAVKELVPSYDELVYMVCLAAVGIKGVTQIAKRL